MRKRVMNQLHVVALNEGLRRKKALWRAASRREPESIALARRATRQHLRPLDQDRFFVGISGIAIGTSCIQPQQPILSITLHVLKSNVARVPLDESEGSVKGTLLLGGARAPLLSPEKVEDQDSA